jgi:hypothetical protein
MLSMLFNGLYSIQSTTACTTRYGADGGDAEVYVLIEAYIYF